MRPFAPALAPWLFLAAQGGVAPGDDVYTRPGQIVAAADGARLNFYCMGSGSPTVIFDSGWEDWAPAWAVVQPQVAKWTRACSYDRAGAGFSSAGPMPRTSVRIADELHSVLHTAGIDRAVHSGRQRVRRRPGAHIRRPVHAGDRRPRAGRGRRQRRRAEGDAG